MPWIDPRRMTRVLQRAFDPQAELDHAQFMLQFAKTPEARERWLARVEQLKAQLAEAAR